MGLMRTHFFDPLLFLLQTKRQKAARRPGIHDPKIELLDPGLSDLADRLVSPFRQRTSKQPMFPGLPVPIVLALQCPAVPWKTPLGTYSGYTACQWPVLKLEQKHHKKWWFPCDFRSTPSTRGPSILKWSFQDWRNGVVTRCVSDVGSQLVGLPRREWEAMCNHSYGHAGRVHISH